MAHIKPYAIGQTLRVAHNAPCYAGRVFKIEKLKQAALGIPGTIWLNIEVWDKWLEILVFCTFCREESMECDCEGGFSPMHSAEVL